MAAIRRPAWFSASWQAIALARGTALRGAAPAAPTGAAYSVLLLLHVALAVIGFGALVITGWQAARAVRGPAAPGAAAVRRYFRPGVNWPGRALYGVPVLGFLLIADSAGDFHAGDGFVVAGLLLWLVATVLAEAVVWPAERRIQAVVTERWAEGLGERAFGRDCRNTSLASCALAALFVTAAVVMTAKP